MSDATDGDGDADGSTCRSCGDRIEDADDQRVATKVEDGKAVYLRFCGDECFEEWRSGDGFETWNASPGSGD